MSNATFSRKPLVAAVLTTLAVFSAGAMAGETEEAKTNVKLTIGTAESTTDKTVAGTVQNEQTWDEAWAKKFDDKFTNASGTVTIDEDTEASHKTITIGKGTDDKTSGKLTNKLSSLTLNVALTSMKAARSSTTARSKPTRRSRSTAPLSTRARSRPTPT